MLFKGITLSCASPSSTAVCSATGRRRSLGRLRSSSISTISSRYLLDEELDKLFDAESLSSLRIPSTVTVEKSSSTATVTAAANVTSHMNYLRSTIDKTSWVRFHTVDGGESATLCRAPPRLLAKAATSGVEGGDTDALLLKSTARDQVVVLRVSLHCKGCEGKVRKHISRMPGVRSFDIDFASKKVTVAGDVTPLGVLSSISKVKNAQFWPSPAP